MQDDERMLARLWVYFGVKFVVVGVVLPLQRCLEPVVLVFQADQNQPFQEWMDEYPNPRLVWSFGGCLLGVPGH